MCFQIFSFWGTELMCFQIFFRGQNLCVSRYFLFEVDRIYVFPDIFLKGTICVFTEMDWT